MESQLIAQVTFTSPRFPIIPCESWRPMGCPSLTGKAPTRASMGPEGSPLVLATWGSSGSGDGQFSDHTSVAVDPNTNTVYVADPINRRIQVFDSDGKFLTKWLVPEWGRPQGFEDLAIDPDKGRLYASSVNMNTILVFDLQGNRIGTLAPPPPDKLEGPSALALSKDKLFVLNTASERLSLIVLQNR